MMDLQVDSFAMVKLCLGKYYWSSTLCEKYNDDAYTMCFANPDSHYWSNWISKYQGRPVRPVE